MTINEIIEKRRRLWVKSGGNIAQDRDFIESATHEILNNKNLLAEILEKPYLLIESVFQIVNKKRKTVPFFLNFVQKDFISKLETHGAGRPYFILKGRQQGFTSLITAIQLCYAITKRNFAGFTIADRSDNTRAIFNDKAKMVYERLPSLLKPTEKFNSVNEMFFSKLNSSWRIATATDDVGRSRTLNFVHFSEVAFYECSLASIQAGIGEATTPDALIIYETTANGFNQAKELWDSGACVNLFYQWWHTEEYFSNDLSALSACDQWLSQRIGLLRGFGLNDEQIAWYAKKYLSYLDKNLIMQEYPISAGEAFVSSGKSIFDEELITAQMLKISNITPVAKGKFECKKQVVPVRGSAGQVVDTSWKIEKIEFVNQRDGLITIHEKPLKKYDEFGNVTALAPYVIGGDTAGSGEDYFTAKVICNLDGRTVATLRIQHIDEDLYAEQVYCLAKYYNDAYVGLEINYSRLPMRLLQGKYLYPNLYMRERLNGIADRTVLDIGFETTVKTKPIIISELVQIMRENPEREVDVQTLKEMTTFVRKDGGRTEAINGSHDDLVMALAIAHFISKNYHHDWKMVDVCAKVIEQNFKQEHHSELENYFDW